MCVCGYNVGCTLDLPKLAETFKGFAQIVQRIGYLYMVRPREPKRGGRWRLIENSFPSNHSNQQQEQEDGYPSCVNFIYSSGQIISMGSSNEFYSKLSLMQQVRDLVACGLPVIMDPKRIVIKHSQLTCKMPFELSQHVHELCSHFHNEIVWIAPNSIRSNFTARSTGGPVRINFTTTGSVNLFDCPSVEAGIHAFEQLYKLLFLYRNHASARPVHELMKKTFGTSVATQRFQGWILDQISKCTTSTSSPLSSPVFVLPAITSANVGLDLFDEMQSLLSL